MSYGNRRQQRCLTAIEQVLEFLQRGDGVRETTRQLEKRFVSAGSIVESNLSALAGGLLRESDAQLLSYIPGLTRAALVSRFPAHLRLNTFSAAADYLRSLYIGIPIEQFYLLLLDASGRLIKRELLQKGTLDETPFYLGHLLQSVITSGAEAIVLSHNHPGGTLRPSHADINCTLDALTALYPLRILLLDHIIIAGQEAISIRENGFISAGLWQRQDPESKLLRKWLSEPKT